MLRCPVCKSRDIHRNVGYYSQKYRCNRCGYQGTFVLDVQGSRDEPDPPVSAAAARRIADHPVSDPADANSMTDNPAAVVLIILFILLAAGTLAVILFR